MAIFEGKQYRLRAGSPMPTSIRGEFVLHTFMAAYNDVSINTCTTSLPSSSEFRGQGGNFMNASFSQLPYKGGTHFQGKVVENEIFISESGLGFNNG